VSSFTRDTDERGTQKQKRSLENFLISCDDTFLGKKMSSAWKIFIQYIFQFEGRNFEIALVDVRRGEKTDIAMCSTENCQ
jgi:hypothetical protein